MAIVLVDVLRNYGFNIGIADTIDIAKIYAVAENLHELKIGLKAVVAKSPDEAKLFDFIFDQYVLQDNPLQKVIEQKTQNFGVMPDSQFHPELGSNPACPNPIGGVAVGAGTGLATISGLINPETLLSFHSEYKFVIKRMFEEDMKSAADALVNRYLLALNGDFDTFMKNTERSIDRITDILQNLFPSQADILVAQFRHEVNQTIFQQSLKGNGANPLRLSALEEREFLNIPESQEVRQVLQRMAKRIATIRKRKRTKGHRRIDLRRTIRANIQNGGVLVNRKLTNLRKQKPRLLVLTDISPSTIYATKFFLQLILEIKEIFESVRFYEFIGSCIDVTDAYRGNKSVHQAIDDALDLWSEVQEGKQSSNYELALYQFLKLARPYLNSKTSILILGDLRDWLGSRPDGFPKSVQYMHQISNIVKYMAVINPETPAFWGTGDSVVDYVDRNKIDVFPATNLRQLEGSFQSLKI